MTRTELLRALPKPELHVHLDGSLRPDTMLELAHEAGVALPANSREELERMMVADNADDLDDYLQRFEWTVAVMQSASALERIAHELALDHHAENVRYLEVRWSPRLTTREGLSLDEALLAPIRGLRRAAEETGIVWRVIVCALRHWPVEVSCELAELAVAHRSHGVAGFDLAAGEAGHPAAAHADAFTIAARGNLACTVHAGEAWGASSVRQALVEGRAQRIGHGTRLREDPDLEAYVRDRQICLEVCLTSNLQTRVVPTLAAHPARRYFDLGIPVSLGTDNRLISGTTLTREYALAAEHLGFTVSEVAAIARTGFEHAFLPLDERRALLARIDREIERLGLTPGERSVARR
ncbi:MAG: adenosine deaminase [Longimicrobiales bacterium]|nr:adenosine deaminase [Longimicrobiales bacterium]